jgi:hypothetical protein
VVRSLMLASVLISSQLAQAETQVPKVFIDATQSHSFKADEGPELLDRLNNWFLSLSKTERARLRSDYALAYNRLFLRAQLARVRSEIQAITARLERNQYAASWVRNADLELKNKKQKNATAFRLALSIGLFRT